jgi:dTDP-4-dehydrorhamnose 3,5-epimerase
MPMKISTHPIDGLLSLEPTVFGDSRGYFFEHWSRERYQAAGIPGDFVQDNVSLSARGILRGLHIQCPNAQGKLVQVLHGEVFDVAVDVRRNSPSFAKYSGMVLSAENHLQFWVPPGFAHGFLVLSETALFQYKCTRYYAPSDELTIRWDDPEIGIDWPIRSPNLSAKDARGVLLRDVPPDRLPLEPHG